MAAPLRSILNTDDGSSGPSVPGESLFGRRAVDPSVAYSDGAGPSGNRQASSTSNSSSPAPSSAASNAAPPDPWAWLGGTVVSRQQDATPAPPPPVQPVQYELDAIEYPPSPGEPPEHEYNFGCFNIFMAITNHPVLVYEFSKHLDPEDLVSLYAISKDFHAMLNGQFSTFITTQARLQAPESAQAFPFKCYRSLCITDPVARPNAEAMYKARYVPSFRWLRMVLYREAVVDEIAQLLANQYHMLPRACKRVMKMVWFLMDIPDTQRREGLVHNKAHWKHEDLFLACMFFMKLDLRFTNVFEGNGERMLRKMLMSQRSLSMVLKALNGEVMRNAYEVMKMYVEWKYTVPENPSHPTIFRLPLSEVGRLLCEGWKQGGAPLVPPDTVILRESVRRKLNLHNKILTMMIWAPRLMGDKIKGEDSEDEDGPDDGPDQQPGEDSGDVEVEDAEDEVEPEDMDLDA